MSGSTDNKANQGKRFFRRHSFVALSGSALRALLVLAMILLRVLVLELVLVVVVVLLLVLFLVFVLLLLESFTQRASNSPRLPTTTGLDFSMSLSRGHCRPQPGIGS